MVRPHCSSSSVRLPSHRVPVNNACVDPAQRQVDDRRDVRVVAAHPFGESCPSGTGTSRRNLSERVSAGPASASDCSTGPRSFSSWTRFSLVWLTESAASALNLPSCAERLGQVVPLVFQHGQRIRDGLQGLVDHRLLVGELADQVVQAVGGGDDVVFLVVEVADELVELPEQASQVLLATGKRGAQRLGDVLDVARGRRR